MIRHIHCATKIQVGSSATKHLSTKLFFTPIVFLPTCGMDRSSPPSWKMALFCRFHQVYPCSLEWFDGPTTRSTHSSECRTERLWKPCKTTRSCRHLYIPHFVVYMSISPVRKGPFHTVEVDRSDWEQGLGYDVISFDDVRLLGILLLAKGSSPTVLKYNTIYLASQSW